MINKYNLSPVHIKEYHFSKRIIIFLDEVHSNNWLQIIERQLDFKIKLNSLQ